MHEAVDKATTLKQQCEELDAHRAAQEARLAAFYEEQKLREDEEGHNEAKKELKQRTEFNKWKAEVTIEQQQALGEAEEKVRMLTERLELQAAVGVREGEKRERMHAKELERLKAEAAEALQETIVAKQSRKTADEQLTRVQKDSALAVEAAEKKAANLEKANLMERRRDRQIEKQQHAQMMAKIEAEFARAIEENEARHQVEMKALLDEQEAAALRQEEEVRNAKRMEEGMETMARGHRAMMEEAEVTHAEARHRMQAASSVALADVERHSCEQAKKIEAIHSQRIKLLEESHANRTKQHGEVMLAAVKKGMADKQAQCDEQLLSKDEMHKLALEQYGALRQAEISTALQAQGSGILEAVKQEVAKAEAAKEIAHGLALEAKENEHLAAMQELTTKMVLRMEEREQAVRAEAQATMAKALEAYDAETVAAGKKKDGEYRQNQEFRAAKHEGAVEQAVLDTREVEAVKREHALAAKSAAHEEVVAQLKRDHAAALAAEIQEHSAILDEAEQALSAQEKQAEEKLEKALRTNTLAHSEHAHSALENEAKGRAEVLQAQKKRHRTALDVRDATHAKEVGRLLADQKAASDVVIKGLQEEVLRAENAQTQATMAAATMEKALSAELSTHKKEVEAAKAARTEAAEMAAAQKLLTVQEAMEAMEAAHALAIEVADLKRTAAAQAAATMRAEAEAGATHAGQMNRAGARAEAMLQAALKVKDQKMVEALDRERAEHTAEREAEARTRELQREAEQAWAAKELSEAVARERALGSAAKESAIEVLRTEHEEGLRREIAEQGAARRRAQEAQADRVKAAAAKAAATHYTEGASQRHDAQEAQEEDKVRKTHMKAQGQGGA
jgi:hypothetical protein